MRSARQKWAFISSLVRLGCVVGGGRLDERATGVPRSRRSKSSASVSLPGNARHILIIALGCSSSSPSGGAAAETRSSTFATHVEADRRNSVDVCRPPGSGISLPAGMHAERVLGPLNTPRRTQSWCGTRCCAAPANTASSAYAVRRASLVGGLPEICCLGSPCPCLFLARHSCSPALGLLRIATTTRRNPPVGGGPTFRLGVFSRARPTRFTFHFPERREKLWLPLQVPCTGGMTGTGLSSERRRAPTSAMVQRLVKAATSSHPGPLTVKSGSTVRWTWDVGGHSVTRP
jgi:hypothetical protein